MLVIFLFDTDLDTKITLDARLAYREENDPDGKWIEVVHSMEERPLNCKANVVRSINLALIAIYLQFSVSAPCFHMSFPP